jgi:secreted trypsin-like serine protease
MAAGHWVLTPSHCVDGDGRFSVRIGSLQRSSGGEEANVTEVVKHPSYDWPDSDIALLRLDHDVQAPVVPTADAEDLRDGQEAKVLGWGSENPDWSGPLPENLKFATGTADIDCGAAHPAPICPQTDGSVAGGDSGGPVLVKSAKTGEWVHAGTCAIGHQPAGDGWAGYTDITKHQIGTSRR